MAEFFNSVNDVREQMREHIRAELDAWNEEAKVPLSAIDRTLAEQRPVSLQDTHVSLAHGNGGRYMRELITEIFARHLANPCSTPERRAPCCRGTRPTGSSSSPPTASPCSRIEFPGGNIGSLAVHGTTNDLAVAGAMPKYLSLGVLLEEGLEFARARARGVGHRRGGARDRRGGGGGRHQGRAARRRRRHLSQHRRHRREGPATRNSASTASAPATRCW